MSPERELESQIARWNTEIEKALLRYENNCRPSSQRLDDDAFVHLPRGPIASLLLLNWKVWTIRYCVSLDFVMDAVFFYYQRVRKASPPNSDSVNFGLPAALAAGVNARRFVEETVLRAFPSGENYKSAHQIPVPPPLTYLKYDTTEEMIRNYGRQMERRQRAFRSPETVYRRKFRKI